MRNFPPERIVCLSAETVETLYLLGEDRRIVGIPVDAMRPPQARREKPRVAAFTAADIPAILKLRPDLVLSFSSIQAELTADLLGAGVEVHSFNQHDLSGILAMIRTLGAMVGAADRAVALAEGFARRLRDMRALTRDGARPRVYFEEWDEPMIAGGGWISELIEVAGGEDVFADLAGRPRASDRAVTPSAVAAAAPEVILASWFGKTVRPEIIAARPGFERIPAVRDGRIREIRSRIILQPGPAALTDGLDAIRAALSA
jgi:iron complex transport system substrate-binding protein